MNGTKWYHRVFSENKKAVNQMIYGLKYGTGGGI